MGTFNEEVEKLIQELTSEIMQEYDSTREISVRVNLLPVSLTCLALTMMILKVLIHKMSMLFLSMWQYMKHLWEKQQQWHRG